MADGDFYRATAILVRLWARFCDPSLEDLAPTRIGDLSRSSIMTIPKPSKIQNKTLTVARVTSVEFQGFLDDHSLAN